MPLYEDLTELAKICAQHARAAADKDMATSLGKLAEEYQARAAELDSGKVPDIGGLPLCLQVSNYEFTARPERLFESCGGGRAV
jgi:hypothetical protein